MTLNFRHLPLADAAILATVRGKCLKIYTVYYKQCDLTIYCMFETEINHKFAFHIVILIMPFTLLYIKIDFRVTK